jgi:ABC-type Zn uptake system ZnuABC Zn-binding protein ZnuA
MTSILRLVVVVAFLAVPPLAESKVKVVTSTTDLAYFARVIGGEYVEVASIASARSDIHFIEVRPSYMRKVANADVVLKVGLELDVWMDRIIDGSRNNRLQVIDCSKYIEPIEIPAFKADARYGDLHQFGNPHYWLTPDNVQPITDAIIEGLATADPEHAELFRSNQSAYLALLGEQIQELDSLVQLLDKIEVIYYHNSWPYFNQFMGIVAVDFIEPYPGVPPSPSHMKNLIDLVQSRHIKVIAVEPYFDKRVPNRIADETGARVVSLYPSVGGRNEQESYVEWLQGNIETILGGLSE